MRIPHDLRRETIDRLFDQKRWHELGEFEITVERTEVPANYDCGHCVLHLLGFEASGTMIEALQKLRTTPQARDGLVFYKKWGVGGMTTLHYGILEGEKVRSKWGRDAPVLVHPIWAVPTFYGEYAEFISKKSAKETLFETRQLKMWDIPGY